MHLICLPCVRIMLLHVVVCMLYGAQLSDLMTLLNGTMHVLVADIWATACVWSTSARRQRSCMPDSSFIDIQQHGLCMPSPWAKQLPLKLDTRSGTREPTLKGEVYEQHEVHHSAGNICSVA